MPELPEVESAARLLRPRIVGHTVRSIGAVDWPRMLPNATEADLQAALAGHTVTEVDRRGKYLLIGFDTGAWVSVHRKMSGNLLLQPADSPRPLHTHLEVEFDNGTRLRFVDPRKFGRVHLFLSAAERHAFLAERLGPDSLLEIDARVLRERFRARRARVKSLLLDQVFVAGVGNLYADEALWGARIHPLRSGDSLTAAEVRRLAESLQHVLRNAIERRGTSFDGAYRDIEGSMGENQDFLNAYGRVGAPCPRCGRPIHRILIGQRSSHFCAHCQRLKARRT
ncbi:MAG: bifunctional DNA-formamidopyrimidine glycosylase/DNA-(apurinic or apyrimidinic site) lyase [Chloroflexota bacterium]